MMILVDPRRHLAVQPGDVSSISITSGVEGGKVLVLFLVGGQELRIHSRNEDGFLDLHAVHKQLMEASK
ncbi:hypothetical protein [Pseudomonas sp. OV226]|uniref:hypothetical protein n=1 Tax=Pseudomonas sp. OV226 TaxID=2135588 RepID=UPI000D6C773C|nr:hypothetical protein [Pseudomonas sp. OV226]PWK30874.1 hypothetical protein C7534_12534 [Pseudomonas sp. OV226]